NHEPISAFEWFGYSPIFIEPLTKKNTNNHSIMKKGFVKLYREYDERKWASDPVTLSTFIHCLWMARYEEGIYNGKIIPRGSFMISISKFAEKIGASQKAIRGAIERLTKDKVLVTRGANDGTMITICNYDSYYVSEESLGQTMGEQRASVGTNDGVNDGQTKGQQYKKEYKEEEKEVIIPPTPQGGMQDGEQTELFPDDAPPKKPKGKKKDNEEHFDFKSALIGIGVSESVADKWIKVRKINYGSKADEKNTEDAFNRAKRNIETLKKTLNYTADEIIMVAVERNWTGVEVKYYKDVTPKPVSITQNQGMTTSPHEKIDEMGNRYYIQGSTKVIIPPDAPPRQNPMMYWNPIHNIWYQPF
ncbi:MAG: hypothetical protein II630_06775, partial [Bacteroidales bacterium]|nr:hypothetical protein [Bacteroidales bacterium]